MHLLPPVFAVAAPTLLRHTSQELPPPLREVLRRCLALNPADRPTASELLPLLTQQLQVR